MVVLLIVVSAGGIAAYIHEHPVHHFGVVKEGVLCRGGQPDERALDDILAGHHIRTVVNLRGQAPGQPWYEREKDFCRRHGLRLVDLPLANLATAEAGVKEFLNIVSDAGSQPVFVHCQAGSARTGFAVAAYRIVAEGWTLAAALDEARSFSFNPDNTNRKYAMILERLAGERGRLSAPTAPVADAAAPREGTAPAP